MKYERGLTAAACSIIAATALAVVSCASGDPVAPNGSPTSSEDTNGTALGTVQPTLQPTSPATSDGFSPGSDIELTGFLVVNDERVCLEYGWCCGVPEGCGPQFSIRDEHDLGYTLTGNTLDYRDWYRLVRVVGTRVDDDVPTLRIRDYEVLGSIRFQEYLPIAAFEYLKEHYPCAAVWNRTYDWLIDDGRALITSMQTDTFGPTPQRYIELAFDADSGDFVRVESRSAELC